MKGKERKEKYSTIERASNQPVMEEECQLGNSILIEGKIVPLNVQNVVLNKDALYIEQRYLDQQIKQKHI